MRAEGTPITAEVLARLAEDAGVDRQLWGMLAPPCRAVRMTLGEVQAGTRGFEGTHYAKVTLDGDEDALNDVMFGFESPWRRQRLGTQKDPAEDPGTPNAIHVLDALGQPLSRRVVNVAHRAAWERGHRPTSLRAWHNQLAALVESARPEPVTLEGVGTFVMVTPFGPLGLVPLDGPYHHDRAQLIEDDEPVLEIRNLDAP